MPLLLSADRLLLGPAGQVVDDGAVLIEGQSITAVGRYADLLWTAPIGTEQRQFPGSTLLPGLINCHVHLAFDSSSDPVTAVQTSTDDALWTGMCERARIALGSGCTTVRDLGDRSGLAVALRDATDRGDLSGPRILASGPPLTVRGGHCWFLGGEVSGTAAIRERIHAHAERGVDLIKVMASGGQLTPGSPPMSESQFTRSDLDTVVDEAQRCGLPVAAHAHGASAITDAVRAGAATIEHCTWISGDGRNVCRDERVAQLMADRGVAACAASSRNWPAMIERMGEDAAERIYGRLSWMHELGVPLITGTDAGLPNSPFDDLPGALELYTYLGFEPATVIEMATTSSADALGLGNRTGRLAPGLDADIVAVAGDPRTDLAQLRKIQLVTTRGEVFI